MKVSLLLFLLILVFNGRMVYAATTLSEHDITSVSISTGTSFSFTPNATGYWVFHTSANLGIPYIKVSNIYGHTLAEGDAITLHMVEDAEYIVYAGFRGTSSGIYMLNVFWSDTYISHNVHYELPIESHIMPASGGRIEVFGEAEITFIPDTTALWKFQVYSDEDPFPLWIEDPFGNVLAFSNFLSITEEHSAFTIQLTAGVEYTIKSMMLMWLPHDFSLSVTLVNDFRTWLDLEYLIAEGFYLDLEAERETIASTGGELLVDGVTWFSFIPYKTGPWTFITSENQGDPLLLLTDSYGSMFLGNDDGAGDLNSLINVYLAEGIEYVVWARFWLEDGDGSYILTVSPFEEIEDETIDEIYEKVIPGIGGHFPLEVDTAYIIRFTPALSGTWDLQSSTEYAMLAIVDPSASFFIESSPWLGAMMPHITIDLAAGVEYRIMVLLPDWVHRGEGSKVLSVSLASQIHTISGVNPQRKVVRDTYFTFVPYAGSYWLINTVNNADSDPYIWLLDSAGNIIAEDDDSGIGLNAQIKLSLKAGYEYVIRAGFFGGGFGEYELNISRLVSEELSLPRLIPPERGYRRN